MGIGRGCVCLPPPTDSLVDARSEPASKPHAFKDASEHFIPGETCKKPASGHRSACGANSGGTISSHPSSGGTTGTVTTGTVTTVTATTTASVPTTTPTTVTTTTAESTTTTGAVDDNLPTANPYGSKAGEHPQ